MIRIHIAKRYVARLSATQAVLRVCNDGRHKSHLSHGSVIDIYIVYAELFKRICTDEIAQIHPQPPFPPPPYPLNCKIQFQIYIRQTHVLTCTFVSSLLCYRRCETPSTFS